MRKLVVVFGILIGSIVFVMTGLPKEYLVEGSWLIVVLTVLFVVLTFFVFLSKKTYTAMVDYSLSLADMIKAGDYDWVNDNITAEHFPISGNGKVKTSFELVHLNKIISSEGVLAYMEAQGLRPATLVELLAFGAKYSKVKIEFTIVALSSVWIDRSGDRSIPCLSGYFSIRRLGLRLFDGNWDCNYRFLAVRK